MDLWNSIFKDDIWLKAVSECTDADMSPPNPVLVGKSSQYLALIISDFSGDALYEKDKLFASLREQDYEYDEAKAEIRFKKSKRVLHIGNAVRGEEWITMTDPRKLFRQTGEGLQTSAIYYGDDQYHKIEGHQIGGVESSKGIERVKYICSIPLKFGDGKPVFCVIRRGISPIHLVSKRTKDTNGRYWVTSWRLAMAGERDWEIEGQQNRLRER